MTTAATSGARARSNSLLRESVERMLEERCTFAVVERAEGDGFAPDLWVSAADMGLPWISLDDTIGGSGGSLADALEVLRVSGRYAVPLPLAETGVLAGWLLATIGVPLGSAPSTVVPGRPEDTLTVVAGRLRGRAHRVPWARAADRVVALVADRSEWWVAVAPRDALVIEPGTNLAGEPRDTVVFDDAPIDLARAPAGVDDAALQLRGALSRVALMAGALEGLRAITVEYTQERRQFGKPIGSFQAVQQHVVHVAQQAALVSLAHEGAVAAAAGADTIHGARVAIAAAKILAGDGATIATRAAHQAHGAIGMTREYPLHHLSRRLWSWREEYGSASTWASALGADAGAVGADGLYSFLTAGPARVQA